MKTLEITSYEHWTLTMRERSEDLPQNKDFRGCQNPQKIVEGEKKKIVHFKKIMFRKNTLSRC